MIYPLILYFTLSETIQNPKFQNKISVESSLFQKVSSVNKNVIYYKTNSFLVPYNIQGHLLLIRLFVPACRFTKTLFKPVIHLIYNCNNIYY